MFSHHSKRNGAIMMISFSGSITDRVAAPMPGFQDAINGQCTGVILDLSDVEYVNSIGVSSFMETFKYARAKGMNVVICSPIPQVLKVLRLARTDLLVPVAESRSSASNLLIRMQINQVPTRRENILLVQGQIDIQAALKEVLKATEQEVYYNIVTALNPLRAWKILGGNSIQLVILDVTLPSKEGLHFLRQVRTHRELKGIPFLVASDERHLSDAAHYTKNGADDILRFPFNPYETPVRLRTALSLYYNWQETLLLSKNPGFGNNPSARI
jgi:anti-anti-sigma factor